jgi:hypothetical protein
LREEKFKDFKKEEHHRGERHRGREHATHQRGGAKTFRRGRAIAFLEMLNLKRATIKQQLEEPEFQSINQILIGELKAIDMVKNEFIQLFELHEGETMDLPFEKMNEEASALKSKESLVDGDEPNETN